jgi:hypothetical protein
VNLGAALDAAGAVTGGVIRLGFFLTKLNDLAESGRSASAYVLARGGTAETCETLQPPRDRRGSLPESRVGRNLKRVERHREHLVVTDQHAELDEPSIVITPAQLGPHSIREGSLMMQLAGRPQQQALVFGEIGCGGRRRRRLSI